MWKADPNEKCIHKNRHDHIHIYMQNMFVIMDVRGAGTRKKNVRESTISKYFTFMKVEEIKIGTESC
jgi:hypothetical protein